MAKSEKRISINMFEKVMKADDRAIVTERWHDIDVTVKRCLSFMDMLAFADDVAMSCFNDTNGFMPELMDFAVRSNILTRYANFTLPDNLEKRYEMIYGTDAVDFVLEFINMQQLQELINAINRKIEYLCSTNVSAIQKEVTRLMGAFEEMRQRTDEVFSGISADDFGKLMGALAETGKLDEEKIVSALMKQKGEDTGKEDTGT